MIATAPPMDLVEAIVDAARKAFRRLFADRPDDAFYYCSLTTTGEGHTPTLTAWSRQALEEVVQSEGGGAELMNELKWSYADSPFYCYGEEEFRPVKELFEGRSSAGDRDSTSDEGELKLRLATMEEAMRQLDAEGLFGTGQSRLGLMIGAEVMPPDGTNVERVRRLNPAQALKNWLEEAAEF